MAEGGAAKCKCCCFEVELNRMCVRLPVQFLFILCYTHYYDFAAVLYIHYFIDMSAEFLYYMYWFLNFLIIPANVYILYLIVDEIVFFAQATKLEEHNRKYERLRKDREIKEKTERIRKAKEAAKKVCSYITAHFLHKLHKSFPLDASKIPSMPEFLPTNSNSDSRAGFSPQALITSRK